MFDFFFFLYVEVGFYLWFIIIFGDKFVNIFVVVVLIGFYLIGIMILVGIGMIWDNWFFLF